MQALRQIHVAHNDTVSVVVPSAFQHRRLEILVMPLDEAPALTWPEGFFAQTAGSFAHTPLVRDTQGAYDARDEVR